MNSVVSHPFPNSGRSHLTLAQSTAEKGNIYTISMLKISETRDFKLDQIIPFKVRKTQIILIT